MSKSKYYTLFAALAFLSCFLFSCTCQQKTASDGSLSANFFCPAPLDIQEQIDSLPPEGGTVKIPAGTHILKKGLHINRSNVWLSGEPGACLKLADDVMQPLILIGSDEEIPKYHIKNITISSLELDGNMRRQATESDKDRIWIKNNILEVRMVENLWIYMADVHDARSGGLVVSWDSKNIFVHGSVFHDNTFDGIAICASENIFISGFYCYNNHSAGISMDNSTKHAVFTNGIIKNNYDVGIFAREAYDLSFHNLLIANNKNNGCFLAHNNIRTHGTGVRRAFFSGCSFLDNKGWGLWLASTKDLSHSNAVGSSLFSGNSSGAILVDEGGELDQEGNIFQKNGITNHAVSH